MAGELTHQRHPHNPGLPPGVHAPPPPEGEASEPPPPVAHAQAPVESVEDRLDRLRKEGAARDKRQSEIAKAREAEWRELDSRMAQEYGTRGEDYEIVDGGKHGPIALVMIEGVGALYKSYRAKVRKDADKQEDLVAFVRPCVVHPSKERFDSMTREHGFILDRCGSELLAMCGGWEDRTKGKS